MARQENRVFDLGVQVVLPRKMFVAGEPIPVQIILSNRSGRDRYLADSFSPAPSFVMGSDLRILKKIDDQWIDLRYEGYVLEPGPPPVAVVDGKGVQALPVLHAPPGWSRRLGFPNLTALYRLFEPGEYRIMFHRTFPGYTEQQVQRADSGEYFVPIDAHEQPIALSVTAVGVQITVEIGGAGADADQLHAALLAVIRDELDRAQESLEDLVKRAADPQTRALALYWVGQCHEQPHLKAERLVPEHRPQLAEAIAAYRSAAEALPESFVAQCARDRVAVLSAVLAPDQAPPDVTAWVAAYIANRPPPKATEVGGLAQELDRLFDVLSTPSRNKELFKAELAAAAAAVVKIGDDAIDPLLAKLRRGSLAFRHRATPILKTIGTPKAQAALLDIALGRTNEELSGIRSTAAKAYVLLLEDRSEARSLLASNDPGVQWDGLSALRGLPVDAELLERLAQLLRSGDRSVRWTTAAVLAEDPQPNLTAEKVSVMLAAADAVQTMPGAEEHPTWHGLELTHAERTYVAYIDALARMAGADEPLRKMTDGATGAAWQVAVIARAERGDATAKESIQKILRDPKAGLMRARAARAMAKVGAEEDLPLLQELAERDPLMRPSHTDVGPPFTTDTYPVREAAKRALEQIGKRQQGAAP